jgi:hypothetical protein
MPEHHDDVFGPPRPLPDYMQPGSGGAPLMGDDLRFALSTKTLRVLARLLDSEQLAGQVLLTHREGSPWLEIAVAVPLHEEGRVHVAPEVKELASGGLAYKFAIWRYTERIYRVGADGAVEGDPIELGSWWNVDQD